MWPFSFAETLTLIGVISTAFISIVNSIKTKEVHQLVNKNFSEQKQEITNLRGQLVEAQGIASRDEGARLQLTSETTKPPPVG